MSKMKQLVVCICVLVIVCLQAGLSAAQSPTPISPVPTLCGLNGYDLNTLYDNTYWKYSVDTANCIRPPDVPEEDVQECIVYFSICRALPQNICNVNFNVSACEIVTLNNGTTVTYILGNYTTEYQYHPINDTTFDGFIAEWNGTAQASSRNCSSVHKLTISFVCDTSQTWNNLIHDVSSHVDLTIQSSCLTLSRAKYVGACYSPPTIAPGYCAAPPYDKGITALSSRDAWAVTFSSPDPCLNDPVSCTFVFAFCKSLHPNISESCVDTAVCQLATDASSRTTGYSVGRFNSYAIFYPNLNYEGFHVDYNDGTKITNCDRGLHSHVVFQCNPQAKWNSSNIPEEYVQIVYQPEDDPCEYVINFFYDGACASPTPSPSREHNTTSILGWVLISIVVMIVSFFGCVIIYLAVGAAFQYFVRGERGIRVIPNYDFWKKFALCLCCKTGHVPAQQPLEEEQAHLTFSAEDENEGWQEDPED